MRWVKTSKGQLDGPGATSGADDQIRHRIVSVFTEMGDYQDIQGNSFKVAAYRKAAFAVNQHRGDFDANTAVKGVGDRVQKKIQEIIATGNLKELEEMRKEPRIAAVNKVARVHGFGPKRAYEIVQKHNIESEDDLIAKAPSFQDELTDAQLLGIKHYRDVKEKIPFDECAEHARFLRNVVATVPGPRCKVVVCGSHRRERPVSGDIDALMTFSDMKSSSQTLKLARGAQLHAFVQKLRECKYVVDTAAEGPTKFMGYAKLGHRPKTRVRRLDIRWVDPSSFYTALLYFTGSKLFNTRMRGIALRAGYTLNEYGLYKLGAKGEKKGQFVGDSKSYDDATPVPVTSEESVFNTIGVEFVDPTDRET